MKRVVITGMGIVSCIGNNTNEVLASLKEGTSGIKLQQVYRDIVGSRSWRVMQTLQSVLKPFLKK